MKVVNGFSFNSEFPFRISFSIIFPDEVQLILLILIVRHSDCLLLTTFKTTESYLIAFEKNYNYKMPKLSYFLVAS